MKNSATKSKAASCQPKFIEGEKILCYHGTYIYEAKCIKFEKIRSNEYQYFVHYNGWNKNWDEWVPAKRILKFNNENIKKQKQLQNEAKKKVTLNGRKNTKHKEDFSSCSSTCSTSDTASSSYFSEKSAPKSRKRTLNSEAGQGPVESKKICILDLTKRDREKPDEENSETLGKNLNILIPESLKMWLIDDFDLIIQQNKIIRLPSKNNVESILSNYAESKKNPNFLNEWDTMDEERIELDKKYAQYLNETINGLLKYFDAMLGSQLLYKFERLQYSELLKLEKPVSHLYGPIHFLRLVEKLNQILFSTSPVEGESLEILVYFINDILVYFERNIKFFFDQNDYITVPPFYIRATI
ncbi:mortality factor 4 1 isoform X2 [Brachionus plicatilis]|uniref:Mortality factor 4 1 isoform X2 n=1 Tax=Brachionus plicatilis TaxID=10195 RepID=A0A3M7SI95_BRAPC|nr:mortality factor 4 1 isoform X2 [Brachionus plicatilis]